MKTKFPKYLLYKRILAEGKRLIALGDENFLVILMNYAWKISELIIHRDKKVTAKLRVFYRFGKYCVFLNKKHGSLFVVKYLKASLLAVQRAIAGSPMKSLREIEPDLPLPRLAKSGLPVWIGTRDRRALLSGSMSVIQFYLTLFSIYRVIDAPVKAKLNTITDPFNGSQAFLEQSLGYFEFEFKKLIRVPKFDLRGPKGRDVGLLPLQTSSSTNALFSWLGWAFDAHLIRRSPGLYSCIRKWLELTCNFDLLSILNMSTVKPQKDTRQPVWACAWCAKVIQSEPGAFREHLRLEHNVTCVRSEIRTPKNPNSSIRHLDLFNPLTLDLIPIRTFIFKRLGWIGDHGLLGLREYPSLGLLSFKVEAAGKLRVFAMVDSWTQSIFKPLHDSLFRLLSSFPNDSTFNQDAAFKRAVSKAEKFGHSYGFDLSAATDRLPVILQIKLLSGIIGPHLASLWGVILTERDYLCPSSKSFDIEGGYLRYAVGQPMGALSSWAMLALTHHAIVQYANRLIGNRTWSEAYEVLGDDIVIFDPSLAKKYVELMTLFGVELNMSKSVISHGSKPTVEFAKRTSYNGKDVSPLSLKMFLNQDSFKGRLSIFAWWSRRINDYFIPAFKTILKTSRWDNRPGKDKFALLGLLSLSIQSGVLPFQWVLRNLKDQRATIIQKGKLILLDFSQEWGYKVAKAILMNQDITNLEPRNPHSYMFEQRWYKVAVINRIQGLIKKFDSIDPYDLKCKILVRIGLGGATGTFQKHLWLPYLDGVVAKPYLTLRFYKNMELSKYSLEMLLQFLDEVEGAASALSVFTETEKKAKIMEDSMKLLTFIVKTIEKGFRSSIANQKLALESSWTQITERRSASQLNWLVPGFGGVTPSSGPVQWLGTTAGNPTPVEMPEVTAERAKVLFGGPLPVDSQPVLEESNKDGNSFIRNILSFLWGFGMAWLVMDTTYLIWNSVFSEVPDIVSSPKDPPSNAMVLQLILFLLCLCLPFLIVFYYEGVLEVHNWIGIIEVTWDPPDVDSVMRSDFRFPNYHELLRWRDSLPEATIQASPHIGHGWTEPWVQQTSWPEWLR